MDLPHPTPRGITFLFTKIRQFAGYLIAGIFLFFLIKPLMQTHTYLKDIISDIQEHWLILSFGVLLCYRSIYPLPFRNLLHGMTQKQISFRRVFTLFHLANIARYLPGRIWGVVRILSLSKRFGLSKTITTSSLALHVGIETSLGGLIGVSLIFSHQMRDTVQGVLEKFTGNIAVLLMITVVGILTGILLLIPMLSSYIHQFLKTLWDIGTPLFQKTFRHQWLNILATHIFLWIGQGLAFFLFVKSLAPVQWKEATVLTACYAFAWIVGLSSFLTPGGLGVRETLLGFLLSNYMFFSQATLIALLCRVWILSAEILLAGVALFLDRNQNREREQYF